MKPYFEIPYSDPVGESSHCYIFISVFNSVEPPGPIDNSKICQMKNGVLVLIVNSDYAQISESMWALLKDVYGGGPEVLCRPAAASPVQGTSPSRLEDNAETPLIQSRPDSTSSK